MTASRPVASGSGPWRRVRDLLAYVLIAIALLGGLAVFAFHQARTGGSPELPLKWLGFSGMTVIVFGSAVRQRRVLWRSSRFWLIVSAGLAVHTGLGVLVLRNVSAVPLLLFAVITPIEYAAVGFCLTLVFRDI